MNYSFKLKGEDFVYAQSYDINASYKDLGGVCDAIRYVKASDALDILDKVIDASHAIPFKRHNKHMGSRHELGGSKGKYPKKAATEVKKTLTNAIANAGNKGKLGADMIVIGASANKTRIESRYPSKGSIAWGRGMYGRSATNHSDLEYAKIEIVLADEFSDKLTKNMKYFIKKANAGRKAAAPKKAVQAKPKTPVTTAKPAVSPKPAPKVSEAKEHKEKSAATDTAATTPATKTQEQKT